MFVNGDELVQNTASVIAKIQTKLSLDNEMTEDDFYYNEETGMFCAKSKYVHHLHGREFTDCLDEKNKDDEDGMNIKGRIRSKTNALKMDDETRQILNNFYKRWNQEFYALVGEDFGW